MKVLYIDPWCANKSNLYYYSTGLSGAIAEMVDLEMVSQVNCDFPNGVNYKVQKVFFPISYSMSHGKIRNIVRGIEYIKAYRKIEQLCKRENYDVIHIEWLLLYKFDIEELKRLKKYCKILVLKAHNVLPHSSGNKYKEIFNKIYGIPDIILVHGENLKKEFIELFPRYEGKIRIQKHGLYMNHDKSFDIKTIDKKLVSVISSHNRVYLFCGRIDFDKGVDRLVEAWNKKMRYSGSLLIIAGKVSDNYDFSFSEDLISKCDNVLRISGFVEDQLLNYLISVSNLIILPYRDGSMSGVAFTAAEFSKPLLTTRFGVIDEYLINDENSYIVENSSESLMSKLLEIDKTVMNSSLEIMGNRLNTYFNDNFSWPVIGRKLVDEVYKKVINQ